MFTTIRRRILGGFGAMVLLVAALGAGSVVVRQTQELLDRTYHQDLVALDRSAVVLAQLHNLRVSAHRFVGAPSAEREALILQTLNADLQAYEKQVADLEATPLAKARAIDLAGFKAASDAFLAVVVEVMGLKVEKGATKAAWRLERAGRERFLASEAAMAAVHDRVAAIAQSRYEASVRLAEQALWAMVGMLALALMVAGLGTAWLARTIAAPILTMRDVAAAIAEGRLAVSTFPPDASPQA
jgi:hypothetical protein